MVNLRKSQPVLAPREAEKKREDERDRDGENGGKEREVSARAGENVR